MAFVSMTGFAEGAGAHDSLRWRWEAKSVNGKGLDLRLRIPPGFDGLEQPARLLAAERFRRGSFQVSLTVETQEAVRGLKIDPVALASAVRLAKEVAAETGLAPARVDGLLALKGVIVQEEIVLADPVQRAGRDAAILKSLANAFDALVKARCSEGLKLAALMNGQVDEVERLTREASALASAQLPMLRERLMGQIKELLDATPIAEERLAQEVALLAVKADVREELDRLKAHVQEARALMASGDAIGRKLDFLSQEFNREANTLCSKSTDIALTRIGLALKAVIDQFREQAQNVE
jgi:uncharacterized protein (TIGR00255 family)